MARPVAPTVETGPARYKCGCPAGNTPAYIANRMRCRDCCTNNGVPEPNSPEAMAIARRVNDEHKASAKPGPKPKAVAL